MLVNGNGQGKVWYGLHFYPGLAEYHPENGKPFRIFVNEDTIRRMDPTFTARPVFVMHVDGVEQDINKLRAEADGWVVESFYNEADGKHWAKFITVTERAERAIEQGMRLSNAYTPKQFGEGGIWNGVAFDKAMVDGEYEHLALVPDPRYDESVILTPEQFKSYNEEKRSELQRLANDKSKEKGMKLKFFKRAALENSADLEATVVELPKSKREVTIAKLVNDADERAEREEKEKAEPPMANMGHMLEYNGKKMTLNDFMTSHKSLNDELKELKAKHYDDVSRNDDDDTVERPAPVLGGNAVDGDEDAKKKALELAEHEEKEMAAKHKNELEALHKKHGKPAPTAETEDQLKAKRDAKERADRVRNAQERARAEADKAEPQRIESITDQVARGKTRYGSL